MSNFPQQQIDDENAPLLMNPANSNEQQQQHHRYDPYFPHNLGETGTPPSYDAPPSYSIATKNNPQKNALNEQQNLEETRAFDANTSDSISSQKNVPQPTAPDGHNNEGLLEEDDDSGILNVNVSGEDIPSILRGGPTVTCRICDVEISLEGRNQQHVVRCHNCQEVTPIRAAPPGKKYVRCPCNCLLVCKASSNRIACPRANCRRVITLVASAPTGTAVRAPAGTCRVQCAHCREMFMFNSLMNAVATCPHCRKCSSVGSNYARTRLLFFIICTLTTLLLFIGLMMLIRMYHSQTLLTILLIITIPVFLYCVYRSYYFWRLKISQVLGPI